jgi:hypothetical protein
VHNAQAAKHSGGFWDLSDKGSLIFKELSLTINPGQLSDASIQVNADTIKQIFNPTKIPASLTQKASGGKNWQSRNHINGSGEIPLTQNGYQLRIGNHIAKGDRTSPIAECSNGSNSISLHMKDFWQNFPSEISISQEGYRLSLFPLQQNQNYELQGGEKKTHRIYLNFSGEPDALQWCRNPSQLIIDRDYYAKTGLFTHLSNSSSNAAFQNLIAQGINSDNSFFNKREKADEYGWRHFGELYADHETLYQKPDEIPLCSHYNNQYDPIYGLARQYIETGDSTWFELMDDLAKHVLDIDIYHTDLDRDEYNHGLFWHTDHYLDAGTCSHRTFSKQHLTVDHVAQSGGGPGTEHCYTTGLRYYYYLTGNQKAREAVLKLNQWMAYAQEGTGSVLERVQAIRTKDIPALKKLRQGKCLYDHRYQLTRGTGNYINVLLDSYYLTQDKSHIERIETIIKQTVHPNDEMEHRHFGDIELTWSYTIFLQALCKYLHYKVSAQSFDNHYLYARDSLLHYAEWMAKHEQPYLYQIKALVYPNHTWVAQDIRKAQVLMEAYYFAPEQKPKLRDKSLEFVDYVTKTLEREATRTFTRILVILMQNQMDFEHVAPLIDQQPQAAIAKGVYDEPPQLSKRKVIGKAIKDLAKASCNLSITREKKWLQSRLS